MEPVAVVSTGVANTASVIAAINRCGFETVLTDDVGTVRDAERVVLPGVGSFAAGMYQLRASRLTEAIRERVEEQRPLLAICLGLQLLCAESDESPGIDGIGAIGERVRRLPENLAVPQFGWNKVNAENCELLTSGYAYYANSYCLTSVPDGWAAATTVYGASFVAAIERGPVVACQFHPELSGNWGNALIKRWLVRDEARVTC